MDDRLARIEMNHDKLEGQLKGIGNTGGFSERKLSNLSINSIGRTLTEPIGGLVGDV